ncbi:MAG: methyltransferase domain-containing protein [Myxococcales bacterium]|nr:MAG: methyltransferase domain-containing protein [Myxococcales bacterium]
MVQLPEHGYFRLYRLQQKALLFPIRTAHQLLRHVGKTKHEVADSASEALKAAYEQLLRDEWQSVEQGYYPKSILFDFPFTRYALHLPLLTAEFFRVHRRMRQGNYKDLPEVADATRYPKYYLRNFHWQSDGYFSKHSARLYDLSVEFLFLGTADVMRRQILTPMARHLKRDPSRAAHMLDVACGTGRSLRFISKAFPNIQATGLDLSPFYLEQAKKTVQHDPMVSLVQGNAETLPFDDHSFDIVSSTYLFHELPRAVRRTVMSEMDRVLKPGGLLVLEDSAQPSEAQDLAVFLGSFAADFHEPYYRDYLRDELLELMPDHYQGKQQRRAFVSKVAWAIKPSA